MKWKVVDNENEPLVKEDPEGSSNVDIYISTPSYDSTERVVRSIEEYASRIIESTQTKDTESFLIWKEYVEEILGIRSLDWPSKDEWWDSEQPFLSLYALQASYSLLCHSLVLSEYSAKLNNGDAESIHDDMKSEAHQLYEPVWRLVEEGKPEIDSAIDHINTSDIDNFSSFLSCVYQNSIPNRIRKELGEFYTPYDLAKFLYEDRKIDIEISDNILDPSCGSGIFLEVALDKIYYEEDNREDITSQVVGMDLNPPAVLSSWASYSLFLIKHDIYHKNDEIPVHLGDVFRVGSDKDKEEQKSLFEKQNKEFSQLDRCLGLVNKGTDIVNSKSPFDIVLGNPAWINWSDINENTKSLLKKSLSKYRLAEGRGRSLIGAVRVDSAGVAMVKAVDELVNRGGKLGFFITQSALKAKSMDGFRRFQLPEGETYAPVRLHDFSDVQLFPGASNRASCMIVKKGASIDFPVDTKKWTQCGETTTDAKLTLGGSTVGLCVENLHSYPLSEDNSPWIALPTSISGLVKSVTGGPNAYRPRVGVNTGGGSSSFWGFVRRKNGVLEFKNDFEAGRIESPEINWTEVEDELIYPLLKGKGLDKHEIETDDRYIIVPHLPETGQDAIAPEMLESEFPGAYEFFSDEDMKSHLGSRRAFLRWGGQDSNPWYTLFEIGPYTFSPFKVGYRGQVATEFVASVISSVDDPVLGNKMVIPDQTVNYIPTDSESEAYYISGILNSVFVRLLYVCFDYKHPSTFFVKALTMPEFSESSTNHTRVSSITKRLAADGGEELKKSLDYAVGDLLQIDSNFVEKCRGEIYERR